ncbi:hypothetical protein KY363_06540 [Candidatus Woesearchaeota archaeon]|nr:hypothetical protein [Candidatus Woesearchaeota archaeon]
MRNKTAFTTSCSLFLILIILAGCSTQPPEPETLKRNVLNVYVDGGNGTNEGAILIAKIHIDNGSINLTQLSTHPENEKLESAIKELEMRPSLELTFENMEDDGKLVMYSVNITTEDPNYLDALHDALVHYGIKSVVGKETIRIQQ